MTLLGDEPRKRLTMYKGTIFLPPHKSTWEVLRPFETQVGYVGNNTGDVDDIIIACGLKLIKKDDDFQSTFLIPAGSRFKVVYRKGYGGVSQIDLHFTQLLNKNGVVVGGFIINDPDIPIEAEQLS